MLIQDGGADNVADTVSVYYGVNRSLVTPVELVRGTVRSPHPGRAVPHAESRSGWDVGHPFVIVELERGGRPTLRGRTRDRVSPGPIANGVIDHQHSGVANAYLQPSWIVNMGPRTRFAK